MADAEIESKIKRLLQNFGRNLERDVLASVLEICDNDVDNAIAFLQAQGNDFVDQGNQGNQLPPGYMDKPNNFSLARIAELQDKLTDATKVKLFILRDSNTIVDHIEEQNRNYPNYVVVLLILLEHGVTLSTNVKAKCLGAAFARSDRVLGAYLLAHKTTTFTDVLRALKILDAPRKLKAMNKKLAKLEEIYNQCPEVQPARRGRIAVRGRRARQSVQAAQAPRAEGEIAKENKHVQKVKRRTIGRLRAKIHDVGQDCSPNQNTSLSGALSKHIRRWIREIPESKLVFIAMQMPKEPWKELADIVHCKPSDFALPWFLPYIYGENPPDDSVVAKCLDINSANIAYLVREYDVPYSYIRTKIPQGLSDEVKSRICVYETLDTVIWYYEELSGPMEVDRIISTRLRNGEEPTFSYGKLLERLLYFKQINAGFYGQLIPIAEQRLHSISLCLDPPVVVLGDASYSMDVAIRTSTIIASLLAVVSHAQLRFFNVRSFSPPVVVPTTVEQVLQIAAETVADGLTAPACALQEYYKKKEIVKCFVVVTDEIENEPHEAYFFGQLFYDYYTQVFPAKIVFVSFMEAGRREKGRMVRALESFGIEPLQFRFDGRRPDLTKLDSLFGLLSAETQGFNALADHMCNAVVHDGIPHMIAAFSNDAEDVLNKFKQEINPPSQTPTPSSPHYTPTPIPQDTPDERVVPVSNGADDGVASRLLAQSMDMDGCNICMEKDAVPDTALVECGHLVCNKCSVGLKNCPFCRAPVLRSLRIFKP